MSSFLCFVCHSTVNADTNEETREKYREVIGMHLCPDSHLCYICCYFLNKMCMFKSICLKRSLEYPVLFSERGTINLHRSETSVSILCPEDICLQHLNTRYHYYNNNENSQSDFDDNNYCELQDDRNFDINDTLLKTENNINVENNINDNIPNENDNVLNVNDNVPNVNDNASNINDLTNRNESIPNINENLTNLNDIVTNINKNITNTNYGLNINDNMSNIHENISNLDENMSGINDNGTNTNDNATNINGNVSNINDNIPDKNETTPNNDLSEEETSSETDNPSDVDDNDKSTDNQPKSKPSQKELFEKIVLTLEEQKMELEKGRKEEKYIAASYKCHSCAMYFHFKDTYQTHMMRHEESNGEHFCSICSLRFANPAVLRSHTANHSMRFKCRLCSDTVRARQRPTHARLCTGKRDSVNCHLCGRVFQSVQHFQQHVRRYHGSRSRRYLCNVCGRSCESRPRLRTHIITHINRKFDCDQCASTFSSPYTLNQHKKSKHQPREPQVHRCETCDLTYSSRKNLLAHLRNALAHKQSVYKCGVCGRTCPSLGALEGHTAAVHTRSRHLACKVCQKRYSTTRSLMKHMASHKEDRPVPLCHSCGATFKSITILKRHLKNVCEKDTRKCQIIDEELLQVPFFE